MASVTLELVQRFATAVHIPGFSLAVCTGILAPLLPIMCREAGYSDGVIGSVMAALGLGRLLISTPGGFLGQAIGPVRLLYGAIAIYLLATLLQLAAWSLATLFITFFLYGVSGGSFTVARLPLMAEMVRKDERARLMSLVGGAQRWALVIGPLVGGGLIHVVGARWAMAFQLPIASVALLCVCVSNKLRAAEARLHEVHGNHTITYGSVMACLWRHRTTVLTVGTFSSVAGMCRACRRMLLPIVALNFHLSPVVVGSVLSLSFLVDGLLFWVGGVISDRFGRRMAAVPMMGLFAMAFLFLGVASTVPAFILCVLFFGVADTTGAGLLLTLAAESVPPEGGHGFMGVLRAIQESGFLLGPLLAGALLDGFGMTTACVVLGILAFSMLIVAGTTRPFDKGFSLRSENPHGAGSGTARSAAGAFASLPDEEEFEDYEDDGVELRVAQAATDGGEGTILQRGGRASEEEGQLSEASPQEQLRHRRRQRTLGIDGEGTTEQHHANGLGVVVEEEDLEGGGVDLELDDEDLALFNAVHPSVHHNGGADDL